ncbi:ribosome biogenesis GTPase Der [Helicobacter zhangjianzhongii]|uniref:ribosome biogenesis GTPase Der n=1 Tax=Helicobacter zhangjianzhongii TaxID=2974574 RepID=UPI002553879C|nr:ribosome biogenesis GTPase Der [Helicobacter sp. CPD2-1]MDL0080088.1 ribosome biogenesis GTPase Der [Helicobacter sp. CPD2-1]
MKTIAIIGRPNVGKSSLFNRLAKSRIAITSHIAGTTRDTNATHITLHNDQSVRIVDTGGIEDRSDELFSKVADKAKQAAKSADLIIYLVDGKQLPTQEDRKLFFTLHKATPTLLVVNKIDNDSQKELGYNFAEFGTKEMYFISVSHNRGISILLRAIEAALFPAVEKVEQDMEEELLEALESNFSKGDFACELESQTYNANAQILESQSGFTKQAQPLESTFDKNANADSSDEAFSSSLRALAQDKAWQSTKSTQVDSSNAADSTAAKTMDCHADFQSARNDSINADSSNALSSRADSPVPHLSSQGDEIRDSSPKAESPQDPIQVGIIGRVNVGKSSLLNALVGYDRSVVSAQAGTTIDPVDEQITFESHTLRFVDTAGIRRKGKIESLEKFALDRTTKILEQADIAILVLDSSAPLVELDEKIFSLVQKHALGVIVVWNKWDIAHADFSSIRAEFLRRFRFLEYAPFLTLSALTGRHIKDLKHKILEVYNNYTSRIPTARLNATIEKALRTHPIPSDRGKLVKIYYATQYATKPPQIALISNRPKSLHFSYKRYLINCLRKEFGLSGTPILLAPRPKSQSNPESIEPRA